MTIAHIPPCDEDSNVHAGSEIARGRRNKYEYNPAWDVFAIDRTLYSAVHFPTDYDFALVRADGNPPDILVLGEEPTFPGADTPPWHPDARDLQWPRAEAPWRAGGETRFAQYQELSALAEHLYREIEHFFSVYKELQRGHNSLRRSSRNGDALCRRPSSRNFRRDDRAGR